jgi:chorismate-pyruvate lyase
MPEDFAFPLSEFYARTSLALPHIEVIAGDAVPEPYRALLVHDRDMTSTLERFHAGDIYIHALSSERRESQYFREVVLHRVSDDMPVEFGANCVSLSLFTPEARWMILQEKVPLGRILRDHAIPHTIHVQHFFRVQPDETISGALKIPRAAALYGRQAVLCDATQQRLSQVIEILPPIAPESR